MIRVNHLTYLLIPSLGACASTAPEITDWCAVPQEEAAGWAVEPDGGLIYQLYVRSFQDSDGDGIGDLRGVIARLDHLDSLGVETIWLMPVFASPAAAGYNPEDLDAVEPDYGDADDLLALQEAAAARGMRVILDVVINHTAPSHAWFTRALADPEDEDATRRYLFSDHQWDELRWFPTGDGRYYYAFFGEDHPDLDWTDPLVATTVADSLGGWLGRGAGGYRIDAVVQLIEEDGEVANTEGSHCALAWLYGRLREQGQDALVLSEAWHQEVHGNARWLGSAEAPEADLVIDVPRRFAALAAFEQGEAEPLRATFEQQLSLGVEHRLAPYLSSHDVSRLASALEDADARRAWMVLHLLAHGSPILYYGDELDLPNNEDGTGQDYQQRGPMPWDETYNAGFTTATPWFPVEADYLEGLNVAAQDRDPESMLSLVRALVALREASPALRGGQTSLLDTEGALLGLLRQAEGEAVIVLLNTSEAALAAPALTVPAELGGWTDLTGGALTEEPGLLQPEPLPARGYRVLATGGLDDLAIPAPLTD